MVTSALVGSREAVPEEESCEDNHRNHGSESKQTKPVRSEFGSHVVEVDAVVAWFRRANVAVTGKQGSRAECIGCVIAFREGEEKLIPLVFNTGELVAID